MTTDVKRQRKSRSEKYKAGLRQMVVWVKEADRRLVKRLETELHAKYNKEKDNENVTNCNVDGGNGSGR